VETEMLIEGSFLLLRDASFMVLAILLIHSMRYFRKKLDLSSNNKNKIIAGLVFGLLAIYGTLSGIKVEGAVLNVRDLAAFAAGLLGGPIVGITAGLVGGLHRLSVGGFTAIPCAIATIAGGLVFGAISFSMRNKRNQILNYALLAAALELAHMGLILVLARPFGNAVAAVGKIAIPMTIANALGIACVIYFVNRIEKQSVRSRR
jgi:LytS/YehU family sensor histidine kinase